MSNNNNWRYKSTGFCLLWLLSISTSAFALDEPAPVPAKTKPAVNRLAKLESDKSEAMISKLEFKEAAMIDVIRALADRSGLNIVASEDAAKKTVTVFLQNISVKDALDTIAKNSGLWYRQDKGSKTFRMMTTDEYQRDMVVYREDATRIFNLLHPNPTEVATVIRDIYNQRVIVSQLCDAGAVRKLGGSVTGNAGGVRGGMGGMGMGGMGMGGMGMGGMGMGGVGGRGGVAGTGGQFNRNMGRNNRNQGMNNLFSNRVIDELTPDQLQMLEGVTENSGGNIVNSESLSKIGSSEPLIFLSVNCEHNLIILRTSDDSAIKDIEHLIKEMDRPVPQVLLEMKILELSTGDSFEQLFDLNYQAGEATRGPGMWSATLPALPTGILNKQNNLTANTSGSLVYQFLNDNINAKIKLLESNSRVKTISSPVLLASNNRTSVLFVGTENLITKGWNPGSVTTPATGAPTIIAPYPQLTPQEVGPRLSITPKINADKTVTMEIDQAVTSIVRNLSQVYVPDALGNVSPQFVDGLSKATINGIVTAKDGLTVAIGGLIKTSESKADTKVPLLGDIPLFGQLFKGKNDKNERTEMILLITPRIINNPSQVEESTESTMKPLSDQEW